MTQRERRQAQLKLLDCIKAELTEDFSLTEVEQHYVFSSGGSTKLKLLKILESRLIFYQQLQTRNDDD